MTTKRITTESAAWRAVAVQIETLMPFHPDDNGIMEPHRDGDYLDRWQVLALIEDECQKCEDGV